MIDTVACGATETQDLTFMSEIDGTIWPSKVVTRGTPSKRNRGRNRIVEK